MFFYLFPTDSFVKWATQRDYWGYMYGPTGCAERCCFISQTQLSLRFFRQNAFKSATVVMGTTGKGLPLIRAVECDRAYSLSRPPAPDDDACVSVDGMIIGKGKGSTWRHIFQCHFVQHKSHINWRGIKPGLPRWEVDDSLRYSTVAWVNRTIDSTAEIAVWSIATQGKRRN
jgi:hypothetical protein